MVEEGICFSPYFLKLSTVVWWYLSLAIVLAREDVDVHLHVSLTKTENYWLCVRAKCYLEKLHHCLGKTLDHRMHHVVPGSNLTTQSNFETSIMPRYCCSGRHRSASICHSWNQAFSIIDFIGHSPNINPTWCCEKHGLLIWLYYMLPCIRCTGFVIITPPFWLFSTVFSNQSCSNCSSSMDGGFMKLSLHCFCGNTLQDRYWILLSPLLQ
jgi:hypothetical protein